MLIEDVACPVDKLPDMMLDLISMFQRHGYTDASCFGHALEGNLHLVFSQGFRDAAEVQRFTDMFEEMCYLVATKHSGSLKGTFATMTATVVQRARVLFHAKCMGTLRSCMLVREPDCFGQCVHHFGCMRYKSLSVCGCWSLAAICYMHTTTL